MKDLTALHTGHCLHLIRIGLLESSDLRLYLEDDEILEQVLCACPAFGLCLTEPYVIHSLPVGRVMFLSILTWSGLFEAIG